MRGDKRFIIAVIIISSIGLTGLLMLMFKGIEYFLDTSTPPIEGKQITIDEENEEEEFYITSIGVVREINEEEIHFLDIGRKKVRAHKIKPTTKIIDKEENAISVSEIEIGEIVDIIYQPEKESLICIKPTAKAFKKTNMTNLQIDRSNRKIEAQGQVYHYTGHTLIFNEQGELTNMHNVKDQDILELVGLEDNLYIIRVLERGADDDE
ncbi:MAG: hypothetical protein H9893_05100 [Candidatus Niameybacter stercoravium]|nr:hypothetical protein [Candidatus Niameybacter stercoravium]